MLTKEQFLSDMKKGWETLGYFRYAYWGRKVKTLGRTCVYATDTKEEAFCACAIGAAAYAAGVQPSEYVEKLPTNLWDYIMEASDYAAVRAGVTASSVEGETSEYLNSVVKQAAIVEVTKVVEERWK